MEWRDFPYLGKESLNAALAARAAQKQGKFWEYHDALYENQGSINGGTFSDEKLTDLAGQVGLDLETFQSDFTSRRFEPVVQRDLREGQDAGIQATPSFNINGQILVGPQPLEAFERVIEEESRTAADEAENA